MSSREEFAALAEVELKRLEDEVCELADHVDEVGRWLDRARDRLDVLEEQLESARSDLAYLLEPDSEQAGGDA